MSLDDARAEIRARQEREAAAWQLVVERSGLGQEDLAHARHTLLELSRVNLDDLCVPPGFNLLPSGEVSSVNSDTPEWQHWSTAKTFAEDCHHVGVTLARFA